MLGVGVGLQEEEAGLVVEVVSRLESVLEGVEEGGVGGGGVGVAAVEVTGARGGRGGGGGGVGVANPGFCATSVREEGQDGGWAKTQGGKI